MAVVKVIPSTVNPITQMPIGSVHKRRVAAYARVSTESDEQATSYEAQLQYYTNYIQNKPDWEYVDVYSDDGITGTSTKNREGFKRMIKDALDGKIDLIITKSISRFARNTLDTINYIRKLKSQGVEVFFEKENVKTFDSSGELMITILASMAQEESRSISLNVTMGKRWGMQEGRVSLPYKRFLGYKKENDKIVIDEEQAVLVRKIYRMFLIEGKTCSGIAEYLKANEIKTPSGKNTNWTKNTVYSILTNEKYKGDALLQKTYISDFLEHKVIKNTGQLPQYYVADSHPAIISKENWEQVQTELKRRAKLGVSYSSSNIFGSKLICEDCGGFYGRKIWHAGSQFEKAIFQCNRKFDKTKEKCKTPHLTEDEIKAKFIKAYNQVMVDKTQLVEDTNDLIVLLTDTTELDTLITKTTDELEVISELVNKLVRNNASMLQDQAEYTRKYDELSNRYNTEKETLNKALFDREFKLGQTIKLKTFKANIEEANELITVWSDDLWMLLVESGTVHRDGSVKFKFHNGTEVTIGK